MTSWRVGNYRDIDDLHDKETVNITHIDHGSLRKVLNYEINFRASSLKISVILDSGSSMLDYIITCDWHEKGALNNIPQLQFYAPYAFPETKYRYDIPFGVIDRIPLASDVPANSFAAAINVKGNSLMIITDSKYGFRGYGKALLIDLIRASIDPDPCPEYGIHYFKVSAGSVNADNNINLFRARSEKVHPVTFVAAQRKAGDKTLPADDAFIKIQGDIKVSALKISEDEKSILIRIYEINGIETEAVITLQESVREAYFCDINENKIKAINLNRNSFSVVLKPWCSDNIVVSLY